MKKNEKPKKTITYKFRPTQDLRKALLSGYIERGRRANWQPRAPGYHEWKQRPLNECVLGRFFGMLHHHTAHGVDKPAQRWRQAKQRFERRYPVRAVAVRYENTYSISRFL